MKMSSLPVVLAFLSSLLPMGGALLDVATLHYAAGLVLVFWIISISVAGNIANVTIPKLQIWVIVIMAGLLALQVSTGRGFVMLEGGFYMLAISFIFYQMLKAGGGASLSGIVRGMSFIYKFFLVGMIIELVIVALGGQHFLYELFSTTKALPYRLTNKADIPDAFGLFEGTGGLNSILLGPQIAGMLSLFAVIWFIGIHRANMRECVERHSSLWIVVSVALLLVTINGTVMTLLLLAILIYGSMIDRKLIVPTTLVLILATIVLYILISNQILFDRIFTDAAEILGQERLDRHPQYRAIQGASTFDFYIFTFTVPFTVYLLIDWVDILIGIGGPAFVTDYAFVGSDAGFVADVLVKSGAMWATALLFTIFVICVPALRYRNGTSGGKVIDEWLALGSINAYISTLWLASTIHYNQSFSNPGGVVVFALHLALVMYSRRRARHSH